MCRSLIAATTLLLLFVGCHQGFAYKGCPQGYTLIDEYCLSVSDYYLKVNRTYTYAEAQLLCQKSLPTLTSQSDWTANLVELDDNEKLEALSRHIFEDFPELMSGLVYWVGGEYVNGAWRWVDGSKINLRSHIFVPGEPRINKINRTVYIVPADKLNKRFYAITNEKTDILPSYVCEAKDD
ncbi:uncharacterized protein LOC143039525 [Oratosquilla oratoria]|uniref:uncharacterized protein LOC143039525 n=1 Tax=Oratosquilla oratoria TaxID=337810 RepID=UPI003F7621F3